MASTGRLLCLLVASLIGLAAARDPLPKGAIAGTGHTVGFGELKEEWRGEVIHLSWSPRAFLLKGFLSDEECDHIVKKAEPRMTKSSVVDNDTGKSVDSNIRTSTGMFFNHAEDDVIARVEKRVAQVTMIPVEHQEGMQVLHYHDGQKYEPHFDYFHDPVNARAENGGQRVVTVLMYLTTVEEGGETVLPHADQKVSGEGWSECAKRGLAVKAVKGDALMFYSLKPDGSQDTASLHGSCPTVKGDKCGRRRNLLGEGDCADKHDQCQEWAFFGECDKNPGFMKENCKRSCKICKK